MPGCIFVPKACDDAGQSLDETTYSLDAVHLTSHITNRMQRRILKLFFYGINKRKDGYWEQCYRSRQAGRPY